MDFKKKGFFSAFALFLQISSIYSDQYSHKQRFPSPTKNANVERIEENVDYSNGFPSGFAQGLPTFDFSGSMTADVPEQTAEDTENIGFVHGPPDGFPSLSQLGVNFPSFGDDTQSQSTLNQPQQPFNANSQGPVSYHYQQHYPGSGGGPEVFRQNGHDEKRSGPGSTSSSFENPVEFRNPRPARRPLKPFTLVKVGPNSSGNHQHQQQYYPSEPLKSPSSSEYQQNHHQHHPNKPIVLKVSSRKTRPTKLPPPPPPFYAPSPDLQVASHKNNAGSRSPHFGAASQQEGQQYRSRRAISQIKNNVNSTDQNADGSETFWDVQSSPFILFDNYENTDGKERSDLEASNRSAIDPDAGEQRFFPSFPAPNPYLGLNPYVSAPPARPPLFPGPTANRAPSRYHPQFGSTKYSPASLPPNRGPSGVYSAENHDHGDRYQDNNLLGSGNFEVVRGGTYYEEDDHAYHPGFHHHGGSGDDDYYHHNGHSSPSGFQQPGTDFFANFRDFADINPPSRSFSHNYETLSLEPAASERKPKNILEKLESRSDTARDLHFTDKEIDPMMATY